TWACRLLRSPCNATFAVGLVQATAASNTGTDSAPCQLERVRLRARRSVGRAAEVGTFAFPGALDGAFGLLPAAQRRIHEACEQGMRCHRPALELRMKLAADEVRMILELDHLHQAIVGAGPAEHEPRTLECLAVVVVHFEAMTVPLGDH